MDKIFLRGMHIPTLIGVYPWERQKSQNLVFNIQIGLQQPFSQSDELNDTLHYGIVCEQLHQHLSQQQFLLLETLAHETIQFLFQQFDKIAWLNVQIIKPGILPNVAEVGVEMERYRAA